MHLWCGLISAAAMFGLATVASGQTVHSEFVVSGVAAERIRDYTTINLSTAERIAMACERLAEEEGVGVSIYILDPFGNYVYMHRMDGQRYTNIMTAELKARTALMAREPSKARMNRVRRNPDAELQQIQLGFFPNSGGLPIVVGNQLIGAIGVGGSAPRVAQGWSDEICAHKAMTEVLGPQPELLPDLPNPGGGGGDNAVAPRFGMPQGFTPNQDLPPEFVVTGAAAARIYDRNQISGDAARRVAMTCREWAAERDGTGSVFILDTAGNFVHMERGDGQGYNNIRTALLKAQTSLKTRQPTSVRAAPQRNDPRRLPRQIVQFEFFSVPGALPIVVDGQMIGVIGVGGGAGGGDEACAIAGLQAVFGDRVTVPVYPEG